MPEFIVTVIKTKECKYAVDAATDDHAGRLALRGDGDLIDSHDWVAVVDDIRPAPREVKQP